MNLNYFFPILIVMLTTFIGAWGGFFLKKGAVNFEFNFKKILINFKLYIGFSLFGISALLYIYALSLSKLNILYPLSSFTYLWTLFIGKIFFKEKLTLFKTGGVLLIIIGASIIILER